MARGQAACVRSRPDHTEVAPDVGGFAVEKVYGLQIAGMEKRVEQVAHRGDVLGSKHQPIGSALENIRLVPNLQQLCTWLLANSAKSFRYRFLRFA